MLPYLGMSSLSLRTRLNKIEQVKKLAPNFHDKAEYVVHIWNLKKTLNDGLVLKKVRGVIKFNKKSLVKIIYWYEHRFKKKS